jgi:ADP-ribose pyrophosphatase
MMIAMPNKSDSLVYDGRIVRVTVDDAVLPNGHTMVLERVWHPGGAAVVALNEHGDVCLLRQYRAIAASWLWEIPAGKRDHGEAPETTAVRELEEEAGAHAASWSSLGRYYSSPGIFDEIIHLYLARDLKQVAAAHEHHEVIEVHWVPLVDALSMANSGDIIDGKTLVGLYRAAALLNASQE